MRRPISFDEVYTTPSTDEVYTTPSTRILVDDDIREFVVDELRKLALAHIIVDENDDKTKEALATLSSLHDACSNLEFKINQEIFSKKPDSRFHDILDFWLKHVFTTAGDFRMFLMKHHMFAEFPSYDVQVILRVADEVSKMSYEDYYRSLEYLERLEKDESIHELSIINSDKYDDDDMPEVAKADDDYGIDDFLRDIGID